MNNYVWNCYKIRGIVVVGIGYGVRFILWFGFGDCSYYNSLFFLIYLCLGLGFYILVFLFFGVLVFIEGIKKRLYIKDIVKFNWMWMILMRDDWGKGLKEIIIIWLIYW